MANVTKARKCANKIAKWLSKHELNEDVSIYVDHKRYQVSDDGKLVYDIDAEPKEYFSWAGDFLSMSFEGPLYTVLNESWSSKHYERLEKEFVKILEEFGKYYELGNAWNLSLYDF